MVQWRYARFECLAFEFSKTVLCQQDHGRRAGLDRDSNHLRTCFDNGSQRTIGSISTSIVEQNQAIFGSEPLFREF